MTTSPQTKNNPTNTRCKTLMDITLPNKTEMWASPGQSHWAWKLPWERTTSMAVVVRPPATDPHTPSARTRSKTNNTNLGVAALVLHLSDKQMPTNQSPCASTNRRQTLSRAVRAARVRGRLSAESSPNWGSNRPATAKPNGVGWGGGRELKTLWLGNRVAYVCYVNYLPEMLHFMLVRVHAQDLCYIARCSNKSTDRVWKHPRR